MEKYKYTPHTADMYIEVFGKTLEKLFENAAEGLTNLMVKKITKKKEIKFSIEADSPEDLLQNFLNELLIYRDSQNLFFSSFKVKIQGKKLFASLKGEEFNPKKHEPDMEVKAITYHNLEIKKSKDGYFVKILVDI